MNRCTSTPGSKLLVDLYSSLFSSTPQSSSTKLKKSVDPAESPIPQSVPLATDVETLHKKTVDNPSQSQNLKTEVPPIEQSEIVQTPTAEKIIPNEPVAKSPEFVTTQQKSSNDAVKISTMLSSQQKVDQPAQVANPTDMKPVKAKEVQPTLSVAESPSASTNAQTPQKLQNKIPARPQTNSGTMGNSPTTASAGPSNSALGASTVATSQQTTSNVAKLPMPLPSGMVVVQPHGSPFPNTPSGFAPPPPTFPQLNSPGSPLGTNPASIQTPETASSIGQPFYTFDWETGIWEAEEPEMPEYRFYPQLANQPGVQGAAKPPPQSTV